MDISQDRSRQPATSRGLGIHYTSPVKKRPGKRKTQVMTTTVFDATRKRQRLETDLAAMLATELPVIPEEEPGLMDDDVCGQGYNIEEEVAYIGNWAELPGKESFDPTSQEPEGLDYGLPKPYPEKDTDSYDKNLGNKESAQTKKKRVTPNQATFVLYEKWKALLPQLVDDVLIYTTASVGTAIRTVGPELKGVCSSPSLCSKSSDMKATKVTCLYFDRKSD